MKLHILFGQRKCRYAGQYAPEALEIMDELALEQSEGWMENKKASYDAAQEFSATAIVIVRVDGKAIDEILKIAPPTIDGTIEHNQTQPK